MFEKYLKNKIFLNWSDYNRLLSKLLLKPQYYTLNFGDRIYEIIFINGDVYSYKFFISVFSEYDGYYYFTNHYNFTKPKNKSKIKERNQIIDNLVTIGVLELEYTPHQYHKNAKPYKRIKKTSKYDEFLNEMSKFNFEKITHIDEILSTDV